MLNIVVLKPMPSASARMAAPAAPGFVLKSP
jgi:hypothetical protein